MDIRGIVSLSKSSFLRLPFVSFFSTFLGETLEGSLGAFRSMSMRLLWGRRDGLQTSWPPARRSLFVSHAETYIIFLWVYACTQ